MHCRFDFMDVETSVLLRLLQLSSSGTGFVSTHLPAAELRQGAEQKWCKPDTIRMTCLKVKQCALLKLPHCQCQQGHRVA